MPETNGLTVREYLDALRHRWWVAVVVGVAVLAVALVPVLTEDPTYASEARVRNSYSNRALLDTDAAEAEDLNAAVLDLVADLEVVQSNRFRADVAEELDEAGESTDFGPITATLVPVSTVFRVRVTADDPDVAAAAAQVAAELFVERRLDDAVGPLLDAADDLVARAGALDAEIDEVDERLSDPTVTDGERQALRLRRSSHASASRSARRDAGELELEADVRSRRIEILSDAAPNPDPVAPAIRRTVAVGVVLALLLGIASAVLVGLWRPPARAPGGDSP